MSELEAFQNSHRNHIGKPLRVDGLLGPQTAWAQAFERLHSEQKLILSEAIEHLGLTELPPGSNRNPLIDAWLRRCGAPLGSPWCAAFVSWCLSDVKNTRCVSALGFARWCEEELKLPEPACVFSFPTDALGHGHCGLVAGFDAKAREILTYEGNVDSQVRCLRRSIEGLRFWRLSESSGAQLPLPPGVPFRAQALAGTR